MAAILNRRDAPKLKGLMTCWPAIKTKPCRTPITDLAVIVSEMVQPSISRKALSISTDWVPSQVTMSDDLFQLNDRL
jgi:hypothetical protein